MLNSVYGYIVLLLFIKYQPYSTLCHQCFQTNTKRR